ncbi:MAG TPA: STAS domain-containing protein [Planctomycetota bacterium]|nr:STAS domain-containing protein [Planctomycetota bacterium]
MPSTIASVIAESESKLLDDWLKQLRETGGARADLMQDQELRQQCGDILRLLRTATNQGMDPRSDHYDPLRAKLAEISRSRAQQGFSPTATAMFVFSLKKPLTEQLRAKLRDGAALADESAAMHQLIDDLGLSTTETFQKTREELINRQQQDLLELSTPVVKLWDGVLALPVIGTLDSARTQVVMESLLQQIVATGSEIAIIDITGVPTVDTLVAQHLIKTVTAARLMGADCIISGIRPQIAQTIVHLGVNLADITTKATLADAFKVALQRAGLSVTRRAQANAAPMHGGRAG